MLSKENFSKNHIKLLKETRKVDPSILERSIYALGLLDVLARVGLPFIFKGGTAVMLLSESPKRLSTDIDIVVKHGTDVVSFLEKAAKIFPFQKVEQQIRKGRGNIEKHHYRFSYNSPCTYNDLYILLDILFEENHYSKTIKIPVRNSLIITEEPDSFVTVPTVDCLLGDKLTAFAPHTTGIPFGIGKELEIAKQMFDIANLFDSCENSEDIYDSYMMTVNAEIYYRNKNISFEDVLNDTFETAACIAGRGMIGTSYPELLTGIKALKTYIFDEHFSVEKSLGKACKVMYLAASILKNREIRHIKDPMIYKNANISGSKYSKISFLRKLDIEGFAYAVEALRIIEGDKIIL